MPLSDGRKSKLAPKSINAIREMTEPVIINITAITGKMRKLVAISSCAGSKRLKKTKTMERGVELLLEENLILMHAIANTTIATSCSK
jgi:hypothetical protein